MYKHECFFIIFGYIVITIINIIIFIIIVIIIVIINIINIINVILSMQTKHIVRSRRASGSYSFHRRSVASPGTP